MATLQPRHVSGSPLSPCSTAECSAAGPGVLDEGNTDIWIWDLARETLTRLTFDPGMDGLPMWTPDSRRIIFMSDREGTLNLYSQAADGSGTPYRLTTSNYRQWPSSITGDGTRLFGFAAATLPLEVILVHLAHPVASDRAVSGTLTVERLFPGTRPEISRDGRYLAYESVETGRSQVHVRPFPQVKGGRWQISTRGGTRPAWSRDGRELFYIDESKAIMRVPVQTSGPTLSYGNPTAVIDTKYAEPNPSRHYDVAPDGKRFLMLKASAPEPNTTPASMVVVLNWTQELKRVP